MDKQEIRKFQISQIELLKFVDEICDEFGFKYYMIGGTLLGAYRHKGFIPWDADIDIAMRRSDYEKFRRYMSDNPNNHFFYQHYDTDEKHISPHAILRINDTHVIYSGVDYGEYDNRHDGIYLDIFPLDEPPISKQLQKKQANMIKRIKKLIYYVISPIYTSEKSKLKTCLKKCIRSLFAKININKLNSKLDKLMMMYSGSNSGYLVSMASHYSYEKQMMKEEIYGEPKKVEFEGYMFCAPAMSEEYLSRLYGDYMEMPPEEKRYTELNMVERVEYGIGE